MKSTSLAAILATAAASMMAATALPNGGAAVATNAEAHAKNQQLAKQVDGNQSASTAAKRSMLESLFRLGIPGASRRRKKGPGWSYAHVKRTSRKARNVALNKRRHRGR